MRIFSHSPAAHIWIRSCLGLQKLFLVGETSQKCCQERNAVLFQLFSNILCSGIVIGYDCNSLSVSDSVGDDIQDRLSLACTRRSLDNADLRRKCVLYRLFLTLIQSKGIDQRWCFFFDINREAWIEILGKYSII